jgi:hypothetical protein
MAQPGDMDRSELARRRSAARRTALLLAFVALAIFAAFFMTGVIGRA